jgi:hypothetical protein
VLPTSWERYQGWRVGKVFFWGYPVAVGTTALFFFWSGVPRESRRIVVYILLLVVVGPLTFINYLVSDQWLNLWIQSGLNLFAAFVAYVLIFRIRHWRPTAGDLKALQSFSILLIGSLLLALPLFYTAIFIAYAVHLIGHDQIKSISDKTPLAVAGLAGIVAVLLNNLDSLRKSSKTKPASE